MGMQGTAPCPGPGRGASAAKGVPGIAAGPIPVMRSCSTSPRPLPRQPSVPRAEIEELATLRFVERAENVLFVGSPGVGKTHLAVALGIEAVRAGREVRFVDCARLVEDLEDASSRGILKKRLKYYAHSRLLIIDELGYLDVGSAGADLLFQLISTRYEQRSTITTTDVGIGGWGGVFGDDVAASAIADRVCHHCHLVKITGRSYRLKDLPGDGPVKP